VNDPDSIANFAARVDQSAAARGADDADPVRTEHPDQEELQSLEQAIDEAELATAPADAPQPPSRSARRERLLAIAAISAGGCCGAITRYLIGLWAVTRWGAGFPWGTLLINLSGSFILGLYLTLVTERFAGRAATRLFVATGFLGAYTTFSTFSYEVVRLAVQGHAPQALGYVAGSLVLGLAAAAVGMLVAQAV
jgi:CrcB protein